MQHLTGVPAKAQFPLFINEIQEPHDSMMWYIHKMHRKVKHSKYNTAHFIRQRDAENGLFCMIGGINS